MAKCTSRLRPALELGDAGAELRRRRRLRAAAVVVADDDAATIGGDSIESLAPHLVEHREAIDRGIGGVERRDTGSDRDRVRPDDRRAESRLRAVKDRPDTLGAQSGEPAKAFEVGDAGALEPAQVDDVVDVP